MALNSLEAVAAARITTIAGTGVKGYSGDGGPAAAAQLNNPYGVIRGPDGGIYICDMDNHRIRRIGLEGVIRTVAGTGQRGYSGDGGPATLAALNEPYEIRFDSRTNVFFVEMRNHLVRRIDAATQVISTFAGTGAEGFGGDGGPAAKASFKQPHSIQFDPAGDLYICDIGNHRIRRVRVQSGQIETYAGTGAALGTPDRAARQGAPLNGPRALDFDRQGNLWIALREGNQVFRLEVRTDTLQHVAGTGQKGFAGNGGPAAVATLSGPKGLAVGPSGQVYLADTESHSIRRIDPSTGLLILVAGTGARGDGPDGDPLRCAMSRPHGVFVEASGAVLVGDSEAHKVRRID